MKGLVVLAVLAALTLPAAASNPTQTKKVKPRPTQSAEPPLALPIPALPQPAPVPLLNDGMLQTLLCPNRALVNWVFGGLDVYQAAPTARMEQLLNESENLRQARRRP